MALNHPYILRFLPLWSLCPWVWVGSSDLLLMNLIWQTWWDDISNIMLRRLWFLFCLPSLVSMSCAALWRSLYGKRWRGSSQQPGRNWGLHFYSSWGTECYRIWALEDELVDKTAAQQLVSDLETETQVSCTQIPETHRHYEIIYLLF